VVSGAPTIVTLGQEAADVLAAIAYADRMRLTINADYGRAWAITVNSRQMRWLPLIHPGNRSQSWKPCTSGWTQAMAAGGPPNSSSAV
jgi:hypothetical protein